MENVLLTVNRLQGQNPKSVSIDLQKSKHFAITTTAWRGVARHSTACSPKALCAHPSTKTLSVSYLYSHYPTAQLLGRVACYRQLVKHSKPFSASHTLTLCSYRSYKAISATFRLFNNQLKAPRGTFFFL